DRILGFEIKSDRDSLIRLEKQVHNYDRFCDYCYIVTGLHYLDKIEENVPAHWGIYDILESGEGKLYIEMYREAVRNPSEKPTVKLKNQMNLLWRSELMQIVTKYGLSGYSNKNKIKLRDMIVEKLGKEEARLLTCELLLNRDYSIYQKPETKETGEAYGEKNQSESGAEENRDNPGGFSKGRSAVSVPNSKNKGAENAQSRILM
ncbi:MAG: sce7726 family protein, partial [Lachnospiraceae bacterium]|nr:sce7726 family protein [Lachnospiraceae bacterium]